jgi:hypothetical protein
MRKEVILQAPGGCVLLADSITLLTVDDAGVWAVSGSHGGSSSASFALEQPLALAVFNDAGIGKDDAGVLGLAMLQARGCAAATVAHTSARIGDALDSWQHGVISRVNAQAEALGLRVGEPLQAAVVRALRSGP